MLIKYSKPTLLMEHILLFPKYTLPSLYRHPLYLLLVYQLTIYNSIIIFKKISLVNIAHSAYLMKYYLLFFVFFLPNLIQYLLKLGNRLCTGYSVLIIKDVEGDTLNPNLTCFLNVVVYFFSVCLILCTLAYCFSIKTNLF